MPSFRESLVFGDVGDLCWGDCWKKRPEVRVIFFDGGVLRSRHCAGAFSVSFGRSDFFETLCGEIVVDLLVERSNKNFHGGSLIVIIS